MIESHAGNLLGQVIHQRTEYLVEVLGIMQGMHTEQIDRLGDRWGVGKCRLIGEVCRLVASGQGQSNGEQVEQTSKHWMSR